MNFHLWFAIVSKLNALEKLAKSSHSQSTVGLEIGDLLDLIDIARAATDMIKYAELTDGKICIDVLKMHVNNLGSDE